MGLEINVGKTIILLSCWYYKNTGIEYTDTWEETDWKLRSSKHLSSLVKEEISIFKEIEECVAAESTVYFTLKVD